MISLYICERHNFQLLLHFNQYSQQRNNHWKYTFYSCASLSSITIPNSASMVDGNGNVFAIDDWRGRYTINYCDTMMSSSPNYTASSGR